MLIEILANLLIIKDFGVQEINPSISSQEHCEESIRQLGVLTTAVFLLCDVISWLEATTPRGESPITTRDSEVVLRTFAVAWR